MSISKMTELAGYTRRAIEEKISRGVWLKGQVWVHAPDGRGLVSVMGYMQLVEQAPGLRR